MLWQGAAWCPMGSDEQAEVSMSMGLAEASEVLVAPGGHHHQFHLFLMREVKSRMWIGCGGMTLEIVEHGHPTMDRLTFIPKHQPFCALNVQMQITRMGEPWRALWLKVGPSVERSG